MNMNNLFCIIKQIFYLYLFTTLNLYHQTSLFINSFSSKFYIFEIISNIIIYRNI
jgi:hypothetical protein